MPKDNPIDSHFSSFTEEMWKDFLEDSNILAQSSSAPVASEFHTLWSAHSRLLTIDKALEDEALTNITNFFKAALVKQWAEYRNGELSHLNLIELLPPDYRALTYSCDSKHVQRWIVMHYLSAILAIIPLFPNISELTIPFHLGGCNTYMSGPISELHELKILHIVTLFRELNYPYFGMDNLYFLSILNLSDITPKLARIEWICPEEILNPLDFIKRIYIDSFCFWDESCRAKFASKFSSGILFKIDQTVVVIDPAEYKTVLAASTSLNTQISTRIKHFIEVTSQSDCLWASQLQPLAQGLIQAPPVNDTQYLMKIIRPNKKTDYSPELTPLLADIQRDCSSVLQFLPIFISTSRIKKARKRSSQSLAKAPSPSPLDRDTDKIKKIEAFLMDLILFQKGKQIWELGWGGSRYQIGYKIDADAPPQYCPVPQGIYKIWKQLRKEGDVLERLNTIETILEKNGRLNSLTYWSFLSPCGRSRETILAYNHIYSIIHPSQS